MNRLKRCARRTTRHLSESQSEPALRGEMNRNRQVCSFDYSFNPADMLPREEFVQEHPERYAFSMKHLCWFALRVSFVFVMFASLVGLMFDPSPIFKIYDYMVKSSSEPYTANPNVDDSSTEMKELHSKLSVLQEELVNIRLTLEKVKEFRTTEVGHNVLDVESKIQDALSKYDADKLGLIDYALESAGASIVSTPLTIPYPSKFSYDFMGVFTLQSSSNPRLMIQPGNLPGECFAFHGQNGRMLIKLALPVKITSVTMEHAHPSLISDITSSPKDFKVYGVNNADGQIKTYLGLFTYQINGPTLQTFSVNHDTYFGFVELHILNNYGNMDYTCIYRFRVHSNIVSKNIL